MAFREGANKFQVPKSTLYIKLKNTVPIERKKGPTSILSASEENEIVNWTLFCVEQGYPVTKSQLLECPKIYYEC